MSESDKNIVLQLINEIELLEFDENILLIDGAIKNNNLVLLKEFSKDRNGYITDSLKIKEVHKNLFYCQEMATTNRIGGDDWERFYENYVLIINNTILKCKVANQYLKKEDKINCTEELLKFHYILSYKKAYEEIFNYYNIDKKKCLF